MVLADGVDGHVYMGLSALSAGHFLSLSPKLHLNHKADKFCLTQTTTGRVIQFAARKVYREMGVDSPPSLSSSSSRRPPDAVSRHGALVVLRRRSPVGRGRPQRRARRHNRQERPAKAKAYL